MTPTTIWLFRENQKCVEKTILAQKTEDPAVFKVDGECPQPGPHAPLG